VTATPGTAKTPPEAPARAGLVLTALILGALVCNINLAAANVALPEVGEAFGASQTALNIVAVGCSLGLAMSVLYFGALADRYGRKQLLVAGLALTVVASFLSAFSTSIEMLMVARLFTGLAAGMAFPTTLSLITALWRTGASRTRAIALWSGVSAMASVAGSILAGLVMTVWWWGSAFLIAAPVAALALVLVALYVPAHVEESSEPVDHVGGVLSTLAIAALVLGISTVFSPGESSFGAILLIAGVVLLGGFAWRQLRASNPLFDLRVARRRMFWVPATGGTIVFGSLMGVLFVGQQYLQNILGYSTFQAGLAVIPSAVGLLVCSPLSARLLTARGSRTTMLVGFALVLLGFLTTLLWNPTTPYSLVGFGFLVIGSGAAFAMTPASRALTESTPVRRVGMASATSDLQRDLGGSIMQAILGAILAAGFAAAFRRQIAESGQASEISDSVTQALQASYASALKVAERYPEYKDEIVTAATQSMVTGAWAAYLVGAIAIVIGTVVVAVFLPSYEQEKELIAQYGREDA
jgi:MFS transporter, DHA2 family, multidrug resistance protein